MAGAIIATTFAVAGDSRRVEAAGGSAIILSNSSSSPDSTNQVTFLVDGPPKTVYVWARNIKDTYGAGAFQVGFDYDGSLITVTQLTSHDTWLESTSRSATCPAPAWATTPPYVRPIPNDPDGLWEGLVSCFTIGGTPPFGPHCGNGHCSGLLATITIQPGSTVDNSSLDFTDGTYLVSAVVTDPPTLIQASVPNIGVKVIHCADFNGNGTVSLGEILDIAGRFGWNESHPEWNPVYDLDESGTISLGNILDAATQFGQTC